MVMLEEYMISLASYRGPGMAGGVSSALAALWRAAGADAKNWFFICSKTNAVKRTDSNRFSSFEKSLDKELIDGHYRYCNEFIWPVMHDLPEHVTYRSNDHSTYKRFNEHFASVIDRHSRNNELCFVQDYQLALVPNGVDGRKQIFWHIPWPKRVAPEHLQQVREIALGLLECETIGFHTHEYAANFSRFVNRYIGGFSSRLAGNTLVNARQAGNTVQVDSFNLQNGTHSVIIEEHTRQLSRILVAPLGLDVENWFRLATAAKQFDAQLAGMGLEKGSYILSVDRADYTKGVISRIEAIDTFFSIHPEWIGKIKFVQICGRTRAGLPAFDRYWDKIRQRAEEVNKRWSDDDWSPIVWLDTAVSPELLAGCYRNADVMLVNPVRDGLNLTAKEFIACQDDDPGVLLLSPGAGAWHELGQHAIPVNPNNPLEMAESIHKALSLSSEKREQKAKAIKATLANNTLQHWCELFSTTGNRAAAMRTAERAIKTGLHKSAGDFARAALTRTANTSGSA